MTETLAGGTCERERNTLDVSLCNTDRYRPHFNVVGKRHEHGIPQQKRSSFVVCPGKNGTKVVRLRGRVFGICSACESRTAILFYALTNTGRNDRDFSFHHP